MNDLKTMFADLARDKKLHLAAGLLAGLVGALFAVSMFGLSGVPVGLCGVLVAACAGVLKEAWDHFNAGVVDTLDVVYTAVGGVPTALIVAVAA